MQSIMRLAEVLDLPRVEAIVDAAYRVYIPRMGREPGPMLENYAALQQAGHLWVLEVSGQVAGILVLIREKEAMLLDNVALGPEYQGRGLGRVLMAFAEQAALDARCSAIRLYTNEAMSENLALYARLGYVETHRAGDSGFHRVYLTKSLEPV
ncbi:GNAT family N-acetyltransferase [Pseudomonas gingeri]|uniref:GNAT family N-acetyltransferase n=1 Tax=Pseudomonas gingeri TaxID=117681 RepID=A0A7Y7YH96_9PSED|nr:GNAT family N-acetyltransferase [Pseudomonas gingeri]NWA03653.1 GNAT family N-acetyltransferase [Pseudomonas gingeri]NWA14511.1 GNAT family N-acetyltransferase [Pseudomonas gingeri]NWA54871.1 GNAT family N-acetyltransferase [Pseudomonas gingeri]NWA94595.1 GNAT family N-acetyltransferase [Pseudomonas gingeri]NWB01251.1 GNAT family N-acetyltransferase [Pseudomonas gingeri]